MAIDRKAVFLWRLNTYHSRFARPLDSDYKKQGDSKFETQSRPSISTFQEASRVALGPNTTVKSFGSTLQGTFLEGDIGKCMNIFQRWNVNILHDEFHEHHLNPVTVQSLKQANVPHRKCFTILQVLT